MRRPPPARPDVTERPANALPGRRGLLARTTATSLVAALLTAAGAVVAPAWACACGGAVSGPGEDVEITRETVVLQWDGTRETVIMQLDAATDATDFALLVPTPNPAEVTLGHSELFDDLEELSAPRPEVKHRWWPEPEQDGLGGGQPRGAPDGGGVEVLDTVRLGPLEATTLAATDSTALTAWLDEHGYVMDDAFGDALEPYVDEGWSYVAVRLVAEVDTLDGGLQPLTLTFDSDTFVYPMRLAAAATTRQATRTYVLSEHRMERTDASRPGAWVRFAGRVPDHQDVLPDGPSAALTELLAAGDYLTTIDQSFEDPGTEVVSDFELDRAPNDDEYVETYTEVEDLTVMGIHAGPLLVVGVLVLGFVSGAAIYAGRRRSRRRTA